MPEAKTASPSASTKSRTTTAKRPAAKRASTNNARRTTGASTQARRAGTAERVVLVPLGAALIAREQVLAGVNDAIGRYSSPSKASAQLRRFERRGTTARKRIEREVRKTRVRVERELRHGRTRVERELRHGRTRVEGELRRRRRDGEELADRVQERLSRLV